MAPLLADVSQGQALRLYQVECLARRSRAAVERVHVPQRPRYTHSTDGGSAGAPDSSAVLAKVRFLHVIR